MECGWRCRKAEDGQATRGPVLTAQDVDTAHVVWGKNFAASKGKTTRKKQNHVARDFAKVLKELLKLHEEVFSTVASARLLKAIILLLLPTHNLLPLAPTIPMSCSLMPMDLIH
jgi:hypothetical protein